MPNLRARILRLGLEISEEILSAVKSNGYDRAPNSSRSFFASVQHVMSGANAKQISVGEWRVAPALDEICRSSEIIKLEPRLMRLLMLLASRPGEVVTIDEILESVWPGVVVTQSSVYNSVATLRKLLGDVDGESRYIVTVSKRGYRLVAPVLEMAASTATTSHPIENSKPRSASVYRRLWMAFGAFAVVGLVFAWWMTREPALPYAKRDWLLITDFENRTGEAIFDQALLTALTISLEQSTFVNVFPRNRVATTLARMQKPTESIIDESLAREICVREGLRAIVTPSITRTGTEYAVAARLMDPKSGNTVRAYLTHAKDENHILAALQELATHLRRDLGESIADIDANNLPLAKVTTPVLVALQQYSKGLDDWQHARFGDATRQFEAAVTADPEFAMAYAALGKLKYSSAANRPDLGASYFQRALSLSAHSTRREQQVIAADFAASRGHFAEALQLYAAYSAAYPDDLAMHKRMGGLLANASLHAEAAAAYQAAVKIDPENAATRFNWAVALSHTGNFAAALPQVERAMELDAPFVKRSTNRYGYGFILFGAGKEEQASRFFTKSLEEYQDDHRALRGLGFIDMYHGKYVSARQRFRQAVEATSLAAELRLSQSRNHGYLAAVHAALGDRKSALQSIDNAVAALESHGPARLEFRARLAIAYARLGNLATAERQLARVAANADQQSPSDRAIVQLLQGEIELAHGRPGKAIDLLQASYRGDPNIELPLVLDALARASDASGNREQAIDAYRKLIALRGQWLGWEAQEVWLLAHYQLARLYQARGDHALASQSLAPLLVAWSNADTDLPAAVAVRQLISAIAKNK